MIAVGTRVSYEDMANPRREGEIVGEHAGQWLVRWNLDGLRDGEIDGVRFHTSVTKQMLARAAERQQELAAEGRRSVAGWNVVADAPVHDYGVGSIVEYRARGGELRRVRIIARDPELKDGRPGFDGELLNMTDEPTGVTVWGYDEQIVQVEEARDGR